MEPGRIPAITDDWAPARNLSIFKRQQACAMNVPFSDTTVPIR